MQAFSTAGYLLGLPRCTTAGCARAYRDSQAEHDAKDGTICPPCRDALPKPPG